MANDTTWIPEILDFHSADTPRGMEFYNLAMLTSDQQKDLNDHKTNIVRENQKYLFQHPEIRAVLQIIMRKVLSARPSHDVQSFIGKYFNENWEEIETELTAYATALRGYVQPAAVRKTVEKADVKHVALSEEQYYDADSTEVSMASLLVATEDTEEMCRDIVEEMVDKIGMVVPERVRRAKLASEDDIVPADEEIFARLFGVSSTSLVSDDADDIELDLDFNAFHEDEDQ